MKKDYYKILEIDRNASDADIKKAFKKLSIKWHPDKWSSKSEKEQKEAEERFKEVNEAYQVLSDPQKKSNYDNFGDAEGGGGFGGFGGFSGFDDFERYTRRTTGEDRGEDMYFNAAARYIQNGSYDEALNVLKNISNHNGKWYYTRNTDTGIDIVEISVDGTIGDYTNGNADTGKPVTTDRITKRLAKPRIRGLGSYVRRTVIPESNQDLTGKNNTMQISKTTIDKIKERLQSYNGDKNAPGVKRAEKISDLEITTKTRHICFRSKA